MHARSFGTFSVWLAATGLAVAMSWYGLRPVLDTAVPDRIAPPAAEDVRAEASIPPLPPPSGGPRGSGRSTTAAGPVVPPARPASPSVGVSATVGVVATTTPPDAPVVGTTPTTPAVNPNPGPTPTPPGSTAPPPPSTLPPVAGWTVVSDPDGGQSYVRTFHVRGGEVAARVRPNVVTLITATPRPGYAVDARNAGPTRLVVRFWHSQAMSTVDVMWYQGGPWYEITEQ